MSRATLALVLCIAGCAMAAARSAFAQMDGGPRAPQGGRDGSFTGMKYFSSVRSALSDIRSRGFMPTGLRPVYPATHACPEAKSLFGATTRADGSPRQRGFFHGYHSGIDIPVAEGTPVLAIADGTVVHKKVGEFITGIELYLQHSPGDTGLPVWLYSHYIHLKEMPQLQVGERVRMGQAVAASGSTGTVGPHYPHGFAHLHLTTFISPDDAYVARILFFPPNGQWADPIAIYQGGKLESAMVVELPDDEKPTPIRYMTAEGRFVPENTRLIWPLACSRK